MRVIFMGTPELSVSPLEHLILNQYQVVAVYTQPDKPVGRGRSRAFSPMKEAALAWKLPVVQPVSLKGVEVVEQLAGFHPDVIVVAAFGQILPQSVLDVPRYGCVNIHPSLLPRFRGASPVAAAILAGDEFTGVSVMLMDKGLDTGPVLTRAQIQISRQDTTGSLTGKLSLLGAQLLLEVLPRWARGEITPPSLRMKLKLPILLLSLRERVRLIGRCQRWTYGDGCELSTPGQGALPDGEGSS